VGVDFRSLVKCIKIRNAKNATIEGLCHVQPWDSTGRLKTKVASGQVEATILDHKQIQHRYSSCSSSCCCCGDAFQQSLREGHDPILQFNKYKMYLLQEVTAANGLFWRHLLEQSNSTTGDVCTVALDIRGTRRQLIIKDIFSFTFISGPGHLICYSVCYRPSI